MKRVERVSRGKRVQQLPEPTGIAPVGMQEAGRSLLFLSPLPILLRLCAGFKAANRFRDRATGSVL